MMQEEKTKQALDLNLAVPGGELKRTGWRQFTGNPRLMVGCVVGGVLVISVGTALFSSHREVEVYESAPEAALDKSAIVAGANDSHSHTLFQSTAQLDDFEQQLLSQEAQRYLQEAQVQVIDVNAPCYGQSVFCPLDQFQQDAIAQIEQARSNRDWQTMLRALDRVEAVELARASTMPAEPEVNLSQLAIDNLLQSHKRYRGASAEAKAWEVNQSD
ncbi:MAG: hypothetical protein F6J95_023855 [Leptolyngbya sp. SIO1E4]|nr:hypothetical protein [Leptolyngbya sp. SIO1E4]